MANALKPGETKKNKFHIGYIILILGMLGVIGFIAYDKFSSSQ